MEITINGEALDLPSDFSIEIEDSNPIYNEREASQYRQPFRLPAGTIGFYRFRRGLTRVLTPTIPNVSRRFKTAHISGVVQ